LHGIRGYRQFALLLRMAAISAFKQTVEVRHVHIHSGGQGVVGIINPPDDREAGVRE